MRDSLDVKVDLLNPESKEFWDSISKNTDMVISKIESGQLPYYYEFVANLFKKLPSTAEDVHHAATGIAGEAGEILDLTKKVWIYGKELNLEHLVEELGDMRFYYQSMLNLLGLEDKDIVAQNMIKLSKRYPTGHYTNKHANLRLDKQPKE